MNRLCLGLLLSTRLFAQEPTVAQDPVDALLAKMTLPEKAGQVLMVWSLSREAGQAETRRTLLTQVSQLGLGGVVISLGSAAEAAAWVGALQSAATVPLLIAGDFESGCAFRLTGSTDAGKAMLLGAAGSTALVEESARVTAREARALGVQWNFAPVVDVNVNPDNPIINLRSFGEDPLLVSRLGAAYVRGLQDEGVLATAKHFPGHGDVASDSHLTMPTVPGDRARLDAIELAPFRAAIEAGVAAIMTGHLSVPGLGEAPDVPATLSGRIVGEVLRQELGFQGIVVTDALDMGGVKGKHDPVDVALRALTVGADLLLMPPDPARTRDAIVAAVQAGRVPAARLDDAVRKLLRAKARVGLLEGKGRPAADWQAVLADPRHAALAARAARAGLTIVRDAQGLLPLSKQSRVVSINLFDADDARGEGFERELREVTEVTATHRLHQKSDPAAIAAAAAAVSGEALAVVAMHVRVRAYSGRLGLPEVFEPVLAALRATPRAVVVSFGSPYLARSFPGVSTYLCAFDGTPWTEAAVAAGLVLQASVTGRLPVTIPDVAPRGAGRSLWPVSSSGALPTGGLTDAGFSAELPAEIEKLLWAACEERAFPGAVCQIARHGRVVFTAAVGRVAYAPDAAGVTPATPYDLASLTKVCATTPVVLRLVAAGSLSLEQRVDALVPEFVGTGKDRVTIRHLLTHTSGLPAYLQFYKTIAGKAAIVRAAAEEGLRTEPGADTVYSDLGLILLMACAERAGGAPFDELAQREVFTPLGMTGARYLPIGGPGTSGVPPTEACAWRGRTVQGEVHDENAAAMGGVSGHAGLFATAEDVTRIGLAFLGGGSGWLPGALQQEATRRAEVVPGSSRALGWDTFVVGGAGGSLLSPGSFGHTGFTGTSIWCDPARDLCVVLLTNRVHPTRVNAKITRVRRELHDLVVRALRW